ncbi:MAG: histidine phosphatase family protein [Anaerolineae bacterium]|nr:histidine phosphatase family protein [Anaerolineae bacterium]
MSNEKQWYIFRHGLATHSKTGYGDRIYSAEVLPEGIPPIQRLGQYMTLLPYDYGARSEFLRCQQTAGIVTEATGRSFTPDARLNEHVSEPFEAVRDRVQRFVDEMNGSPYQHIWVCTHGMIIAALKNLILHGSFTRRDELDYTQPGQLLILRGGAAEVVRFDEVL